LIYSRSVRNRRGRREQRKVEIMRRTIVVLVAMALALVAFGGVAYSDDHRPPETVLYKGQQELQTGRLGSYCWSSPSGPGLCVDVAELSYPAADSVRAGSTLHVRILDSQRPEKFSISAYQKVDEWGFPVGRTTRLDTSLRRVVEEGRTVAWDVFFRVNEPGRHYYLNAFCEWENGGDGGGDASYTFHVKTKSS
ncbi:MAG: hypothetical protein M3392_10040, partial [Actinomycetota bacterium]|nr:hypothetical protein [Actinomycetota bacterium]